MSDLKAHLDAFLATYDPAAQLQTDPIQFPRRFTAPVDQEVVGLFAACLAYGRVGLIARAMEDVLRRLGPAPARAAIEDDEAAALRRFDGFVYRVTRGVDLTRLWLGTGEALRTHGTLGGAFPTGELRASLTVFRDALLAPTAHFEARRSAQHLLPDPRKGSACKRLQMYLRWMVRGPDAIDLGLWTHVKPAQLIMPIDTHVHRIGQYLGLTARRQADWRTAEEVTAALRLLDPNDPLRYDFALAHLGISGACPSRRVEDICARCPLSPVCRLDHSGRITA